MAFESIAADWGYVRDPDASTAANPVLRAPGQPKLVTRRLGNGHWVCFNSRDHTDNGTAIDFLRNRGLSFADIRARFAAPRRPQLPGPLEPGRAGPGAGLARRTRHPARNARRLPPADPPRQRRPPPLRPPRPQPKPHRLRDRPAGAGRVALLPREPLAHGRLRRRGRVRGDGVVPAGAAPSRSGQHRGHARRGAAAAGAVGPAFLASRRRRRPALRDLGERALALRRGPPAARDGARRRTAARSRRARARSRRGRRRRSDGHPPRRRARPRLPRDAGQPDRHRRAPHVLREASGSSCGASATSGRRCGPSPGPTIPAG